MKKGWQVKACSPAILKCFQVNVFHRTITNDPFKYHVWSSFAYLVYNVQAANIILHPRGKSWIINKCFSKYMLSCIHFFGPNGSNIHFLPIESAVLCADYKRDSVCDGIFFPFNGILVCFLTLDLWHLLLHYWDNDKCHNQCLFVSKRCNFFQLMFLWIPGLSTVLQWYYRMCVFIFSNILK